MAVQSYWLINSYYLGVDPVDGYYPKLQVPTNESWHAGGPSHIGLLCEEWQVNYICAI